jgi:hypothetical protein
MHVFLTHHQSSWPPSTSSQQPQQHAMAPTHTQKSPQKEGGIDLAIHGIRETQFSSQREAARVRRVTRSMLQPRVRVATPKQESRVKNNLLLPIEEEELVQRILNMEGRGFPSHLIDIKRFAESLISRRGTPGSTPSIGKNWVYRFATRHPALGQRYTPNNHAQLARLSKSCSQLQATTRLLERRIAALESAVECLQQKEEEEEEEDEEGPTTYSDSV